MFFVARLLGKCAAADRHHTAQVVYSQFNSPPNCLSAQVVDVHMDACYKCKEGGDLLCCDGCNCAFHPACVGLDAPPSVRGWEELDGCMPWLGWVGGR